MAMKIHNTPQNSPIRTAHGGDVREKKVSGGESREPSERANVGDTVSLTETASSLSTLIEALAQVPVVDSARVEALKAALADGTFQVDAERIAGKLLRMEKDL